MPWRRRVPLRGGSGLARIRGGSGLAGGRMASEKIGKIPVRKERFYFKEFDSKYPGQINQGSIDSVANTHLFLACTARGEGRLAGH